MEDTITHSEQKNKITQSSKSLSNEEQNFYLKVFRIPLIFDSIFQFLEKDDKLCFSLCSKMIYKLYSNKISKIEIELCIRNISLLDNIHNKYKNIKEIIFRECNNLNYYSFIQNIENLEVLHIYESTIDNITFLENNTKIKELKLHFCHYLKDFSPISKLENLLVLDIYSYGHYDISFLKGTKNIKKLILNQLLEEKDFPII